MDLVGEFLNTFTAGILPKNSESNGVSLVRYKAGQRQGLIDAAGIIENLAKDSHGNIIETIKIITHSMGGVYGSGLVAGIKAYLKQHPELAKQVKISLMAHFDPFQAGSIDADPNIFTMQFLHKSGKGKKDSDGLGFLANERMNGVDAFYESTNQAAHGVSTFLLNIESLNVGKCIWNGSSWECQNCK